MNKRNENRQKEIREHIIRCNLDKTRERIEVKYEVVKEKKRKRGNRTSLHLHQAFQLSNKHYMVRAEDGLIYYTQKPNRN